MRCLHPSCQVGGGLANWADVLNHPAVKVPPSSQPALLSALGACGILAGDVAFPAAFTGSVYFKRLLEACPCLYAQIPVKISARGVVHLCEITLGTKIDSSNVDQAFDIQHPRTPRNYLWPPAMPGASGGEIMEALCSEVLENHDVPHMAKAADGWPSWSSCCHVSLNAGKMRPLKLYGDILVPCAPHNLLISVKSEKARERFVVSGNRLESVGFGFFDEPGEFWTSSRMNLLKRWGFSAIYMPATTLAAINARLNQNGTTSHAININGLPLYRPLSDFGPDIAKVAGKLSLGI